MSGPGAAPVAPRPGSREGSGDDGGPVALTRYAWLSIAAARATIALKSGAYLATGSVGLLSDALESLVNLVAAVTALWMLKVAASPPDAEHEYGHEKAEYFSSALEGTLILVAAVLIGWTAIERLLMAMLAFMPLAFGAVEAWSELVVVAFACAMAACLALKLIVQERTRLLWTWA